MACHYKSLILMGNLLIEKGILMGFQVRKGLGMLKGGCGGGEGQRLCIYLC